MDEADKNSGFIFSLSISPRFVRKLVDQYGAESIAAVFLIRNKDGQLWLDYLLRCFKGPFYRKQYPTVSVVENEGD